ncbi:hypothetical protein WS70_25320 [Burkholderia mayonis]|uniref:Uncharacterized protein n=1 Tax=Burkholderia mayonis TaxID=1385591 RepID=A0A1B4FN02_9BURK|nr:hypothetical protein WS70_25320 [Burkholderia mayonis]KVE37156.1 hypothetical protein WS69_03130 [Burkholderia sp. BDU5]KVE45749.1 hypothetical protein WS70_03935 [Burkholderia mayonis]
MSVEGIEVVDVSFMTETEALDNVAIFVDAADVPIWGVKDIGATRHVGMSIMRPCDSKILRFAIFI